MHARSLIPSALTRIVFLAALVVSSVSLANDKPAGRITGGMAHAMPDWFKSSFLNFHEDVDEARAAGRHILVFMDLNGCPYCARTLEENFLHGDNAGFIRKHFDVIAVNIRGDRELTWIDQASYTEQELALKMKVVGTPALIFIDPNGNKVLQLNGYRTPATLRHALEYVNDKAYRRQSLSDYVEARQKKSVYVLRDHPRFENVTDFTRYARPLAVIFEDRHCADCTGFHDTVLGRPDVLDALKAFRVVRLDAYADTPITDLAGKRTTPRAWAAALKLTHRPGVVLFDEGREAARIEGRFYHFHFREMLRFVSGKYYQRYDRFGAYLNDRQVELLQQGIDIDLGE